MEKFIKDKVLFFKFVYCLLILIFFFNKLQAQKVLEGELYGGTNISKFETIFNDYDNFWGGQGGFIMKLGAKWIQFEGGLEYDYKGTKYIQNITVGSSTDHSFHIDNETKVKYAGHYITIPLSVALGYWNITERNDREGIGFTVSGGGYINVGVAGQIKSRTTSLYYEGNSPVWEADPESFSTKVFGDSPHQIKRFDAGWSVGCMFGAGSIFRIGASYRHGLINISNLKGYKICNREILVNLIFGLNFD